MNRNFYQADVEDVESWDVSTSSLSFTLHNNTDHTLVIESKYHAVKSLSILSPEVLVLVNIGNVPAFIKAVEKMKFEQITLEPGQSTTEEIPLKYFIYSEQNIPTSHPFGFYNCQIRTDQVLSDVKVLHETTNEDKASDLPIVIRTYNEFVRHCNESDTILHLTYRRMTLDDVKASTVSSDGVIDHYWDIDCDIESYKPGIAQYVDVRIGHIYNDDALYVYLLGEEMIKEHMY